MPGNVKYAKIIYKMPGNEEGQKYCREIRNAEEREQ
jgi:hypothetical protein